MWWITCPTCGYHAPLMDFERNLEDEHDCPQCAAYFDVDLSAPPEDKDEDHVQVIEDDGEVD